MSGWRDQDGHTASERRKVQGERDRATFAETLRNRPLSLVRPVLGSLLVIVIVFALLNAYV